jgi:hypothetical protein
MKKYREEIRLRIQCTLTTVEASRTIMVGNADLSRGLVGTTSLLGTLFVPLGCSVLSR